MTKFLLDTDSVESVSESIKSLSNNAKTVLNSINKYNTDNDDNFNFAGAKDAIVTNVSATYIKFRLTNRYLDAVVSTHTELQDSVSGNKNGGNNGSYSPSYNYGGNYYNRPSSFGGFNTEKPSVVSEGGMTFTAGSIPLAVISSLLDDGLFSDDTIDKLNKTDEAVLVLSLPNEEDLKTEEEKEDRKKKIELAKEIAEEYNMELVVNDVKEPKEDFKPSISLVKNGLILATTYEIQDKESMEEMLELATSDMEEDELEKQCVDKELYEQVKDTKATPAGKFVSLLHKYKSNVKEK